MNKHEGTIIERTIKSLGVNAAELARKTGVDSRTVKRWFKLEKVDARVISSVGKAVGYDFSRDFPRINKNRPQLRVYVESETTGEVSEKDKVYWMNKYIRLLEEYNDLLAQKTMSF